MPPGGDDPDGPAANEDLKEGNGDSDESNHAPGRDTETRGEPERVDRRGGPEGEDRTPPTDDLSGDTTNGDASASEDVDESTWEDEKTDEWVWSEDVEAPEADEERAEGPKSAIRWFFETDHPGVTFLREFLWSVLVVILIGMLLFAISGVWPPMVAVKSGSMEPHMHRGDLVFVMDTDRFPPDAAVHGTGVVPYRVGKRTNYRTFGDYGDVIVYRKNGRTDTIPIIHRARFWVEEGENWFDEANPAYLSGNSCEAIPNCPAPHAGFITKGDANGQYDQVNNISGRGPVKPSWIKGRAEVRIPWLGHVRLKLSTLATFVSA